VPEKVGVVTFVMLSELLNPESLASTKLGVLGVDNVYEIVTRLSFVVAVVFVVLDAPATMKFDPRLPP
jgi:hypothetical protein